MDRWPPPNPSSFGYGESQTSLHASSQPAASWWEATIMQALARLETGQVLNRKAGDRRVQQLADHMDDRLSDLRHHLGQRMDRLEDRVTMIERSPATAAASPPPALPAQTAIPAASPSPWWHDMSGREWAFYVILILTLTGVIPIEMFERILKAAAGALGLPVVPK